MNETPNTHTTIVFRVQLKRNIPTSRDTLNSRGNKGSFVFYANKAVAVNTQQTNYCNEERNW